MARIAIPDDFPPVMAPSQAYRALAAREPVAYYDSLPGSEENLAVRIGEAEVALNIRASSRFTEEVLARCPRLRLVSIWGTGTDNVDLAAAQRHGVTVTNTPGVSAISVAEHTLTLMLAAARQIPRVHAETRRGAWPRGFVTQLHGKTLGVIGLGAIGRQVAHLGGGIGMRVIAWTPHPRSGDQIVPLEDLLRAADVVTVHLRLSEETRGFLGPAQFALMKPGAILINTARGPIVDEDALAGTLETGRLAAAGLDVFDTEPLPGGHRLARFENVVLTPHSAGVTPEALEAGLQMAVDNVWSFLEGNPRNVVR